MKEKCILLTIILYHEKRPVLSQFCLNLIVNDPVHVNRKTV